MEGPRYADDDEDDLDAGMQLGIILGYPRFGISRDIPGILKNAGIYFKS